MVSLPPSSPGGPRRLAQAVVVFAFGGGADRRGGEFGEARRLLREGKIRPGDPPVFSTGSGREILRTVFRVVYPTDGSCLGTERNSHFQFLAAGEATEGASYLGSGCGY